MTKPKALLRGTAWAPIVKREKQEDGSLLVYGPVADTGLDRDLQRCDPTWLDSALPEWFTQSANVREMHDQKAVGKALSFDPEDRSIVAHIVDPVTVAKIDADVLQGFNIGIKHPKVVHDPAAPGGRIVGGSICEVSVVDRPANPATLFTIAKADGDGALALVEDPHLETHDEQPEPPALEVVTPEREADIRARAVAMLSEPDALQERWDALLARADASTKSLTASGLATFKAVAAMLVQEVSDLAGGQWGEGYDASLLLDALCALKCFIANEAAEDEAEGTSEGDDAAAGLPRDDMPGGVAMPLVSLSDKATMTKGDGVVTLNVEGVDADALAAALAKVLGKADEPAAGEPAPVEGQEAGSDDEPNVGGDADADAAGEGSTPPAPADSPEQGDTDAGKADMATLTKHDLEALITKAVGPLAERLAKVEGKPMPGGPVRVRTTDQAHKADADDRARLESEAAAYLAKADASDDHTLAEGYRRLAAEAHARAAR